MKLTKLLLTLLWPFIGITVATAADKDSYARMSVAELKQQATSIHPAGLYILAGKLFSEGQKDDAVFWFYVGQIRYRFHLGANPNLDPSGDPAVFSALQQTVGRRINEYAGGDPDSWARLIKKARQWDHDNPNDTTSKEKYRQIYEEILGGLDQMVAHIEKNKDSIREERAKRGLENR